MSIRHFQLNYLVITVYFFVVYYMNLDETNFAFLKIFCTLDPVMCIHGLNKFVPNEYYKTDSSD